VEAEKSLTAVEVFMRALMEASAGLGLEVGEAPRPSVAADAPAD
jgi:hypothetical protein